ncbi:MAG: hypothetical protein HY700_10375 [Gemmatimonadetes bacterium]|nr:hypothetical protein [Gemmatimonadota bacterium]
MRADRSCCRLTAPVLVMAGALVAAPLSLEAQRAPGEQNSRNVQVLSHIPVARGPNSTGYQEILDIEIEQELSRPYVYVSHLISHGGFDIISVKDPRQARIIYRWEIDNPELRRGLSGGFDGRYLKLNDRYYYAQSFQYGPGGPDADLGAIVFDVTGLPDTTKVKEVGRMRAPDTPGGFHNLFAYKHADGRVLLFTTTTGPHANVYDMQKFLGGDAAQALIGRVPSIAAAGKSRADGYHDMYVAYDPANHRDVFYGAGLGDGYFVYDVTRPEEPKLLTSLTGIAGLAVAHAFQVTPDGRYGVAQMEYQYAPLRIFDLKPGLDGTVKTISRPIGAWTAAPGGWRTASHNHQIRWPYVFVASFDDGLQVLNMMDPTNPYTVGFWDTQDGPDLQGLNTSPIGPGNTIFSGAWGVQVRNADGLIVISDFKTGFWAFKMEGFDGWNGHQWGLPNISSAQDWDNGPEGAPKPTKVSRS